MKRDVLPFTSVPDFRSLADNMKSPSLPSMERQKMHPQVLLAGASHLE